MYDKWPEGCNAIDCDACMHGSERRCTEKCVSSVYVCDLFCNDD